MQPILENDGDIDSPLLEEENLDTLSWAEIQDSRNPVLL